MAVVDISNTYKLTNVGAHIDNTDVYNSNRNLLDNWWWGDGEPVNQRSFTSGQTTPNAYCIDRWKTSYGNTPGTISLNDNGLTITAASGTFALIDQVIRRYSNLRGKTVTCSALLADGTIISGTIRDLNWGLNPIAVTKNYVRLQLLDGGYFRVKILDGGSATIRAVKLEIGAYSTLASDVPPDYEDQLRKCRRYFRRLAPYQTGVALIGRAASATLANFILGSEPMEKQTGITATFTGDVYVRAGNETNHSVTAVSAQTNAGSGVLLNVTSDGLTISSAASLVFGTGGRIDISAEP